MEVPPRARGSDPDDARLDLLRTDCPGFRIWREVIGAHSRYIARRLAPGTHPHTVISADLDEIRAALTKPAQA